MSYRGIGTGSDYYNSLIQRNTRPFDLTSIELGNYTVDGPIRLTSGGMNLVVPSGDAVGTYQAAGNLLSISSISETAQLAVNETTLTLSGVTGVAIAQLLLFPYLDRTVKVWRGLLDEDLNLVDLPILIFDGRINSASVTDDPVGGESTVSISCSSQWFDFSRTNGSKTNTSEQQVLFPGDLGMQYAADSIRDLKWGRV